MLRNLGLCQCWWMVWLSQLLWSLWWKWLLFLLNRILQLFKSSEVNENLSVKCIRLKVICLLALAFMLHQSDIVPHAHYLVPETLMVEHLGQTRCTLRKTGDYHWPFMVLKMITVEIGFESPCHLPTYMERTSDERERVPGYPVFLSLRSPYKAIGANSVSSKLKQGIFC